VHLPYPLRLHPCTSPILYVCIRAPPPSFTSASVHLPCILYPSSVHAVVRAPPQPLFDPCMQAAGTASSHAPAQNIDHAITAGVQPMCNLLLLMIHVPTDSQVWYPRWSSVFLHWYRMGCSSILERWTRPTRPDQTELCLFTPCVVSHCAMSLVHLQLELSPHACSNCFVPCTRSQSVISVAPTETALCTLPACRLCLTQSQQ